MWLLECGRQAFHHINQSDVWLRKCSVLQFTAMPQFVIEREIAGAGSLTEDQIREVSLRSLATLNQMGPRIQWLHSYVTEDKVYCVYVAPDEETIREHARKSGIPANRVSAVRRLVDPAAFS